MLQQTLKLIFGCVRQTGAAQVVKFVKVKWQANPFYELAASNLHA